MSTGGKGSAPRPIPDRDRYEANWDAINWGSRDAVQGVPVHTGSESAPDEDGEQG